MLYYTFYDSIEKMIYLNFNIFLVKYILKVLPISEDANEP